MTVGLAWRRPLAYSRLTVRLFEIRNRCANTTIPALGAQTPSTFAATVTQHVTPTASALLAPSPLKKTVYVFPLEPFAFEFPFQHRHGLTSVAGDNTGVKSGED